MGCGSGVLEKGFPDYTMGRVGSPRELARPCSDEENPLTLSDSSSVFVLVRNPRDCLFQLERLYFGRQFKRHFTMNYNYIRQTFPPEIFTQ